MLPVRLAQWAVRSPEPVAAQTGEGLALLSTEQDKYFVLDPSAAAIWERLAQPVRLQALADDISKDFDLQLHEATEAVIAIIAEFRRQDIVWVRDTPF